MKNIFLDYPEFINEDPRINRSTTTIGGYRIDSKLQYVRHNTMLPPEIVKGCKILDLGCCVAATGAWALHHGASQYVGVELESASCDTAIKNLTKYFPDEQWTIKNQTFEVFFNENQDKFDIVIAVGVIYISVNIETLLQNICQVADQTIIIDSPIPPHIINLKNTDDQYSVDDLAILELADHPQMSRGAIKSALPSLPYLSIMLNQQGFSLNADFTNEYVRLLPTTYVNRYCASFIKNSNSTPFLNYVDNYNKEKTVVTPWRFDSNVANNFVNYARHHIPNYDKIIEKTIHICRTLLPFDPTHRIIDVGCATGYTLTKLNQAGFCNLVGVDSSGSMLIEARNNKINQIAHLIKRDTFPLDNEPYSVVICNWTLHFIKNKTAYLTDIFNSMLPGGLLILTDKTYNDGVSLDMYHDFKKTQGLTDQEIADKHDSVKDIMFIDPPEWYLTTLDSIGFTDVSIIDADFCFTTFLVKK
jgi:tRNA (cmo5U34)-methyltransferase